MKRAGTNREKTNAARKLDSLKIKYEEHIYTQTGAVSGTEVALALDENPAQVFKTLVTRGRSGEHYVFMIPVDRELDLKKAAKTAGEKAVEMIKSRELLPLTGYVHGGCSPIGMKKFFPTAIHQTAEDFETILFSGGKIGYQIELRLEDLQRVIKFQLADLVKDE